MYDKLVTDLLLKIAGWPTIILIFAGLLDLFCSKQFKLDIASKIAGRSLFGSNQNAIELFNKGVLARLPGLNPFKRSFIIKSALASVVSFGFVAIMQSINSNLKATDTLQINDYKGIYFALILICSNVAVDYLANVSAITLFRAAEYSRSKWEAAVIFLSNIVLTINIFTAVFPIGIAVCLLCDQLWRHTVDLQILQNESSAAVGFGLGLHDQKWSVKYRFTSLIAQPIGIITPNAEAIADVVAVAARSVPDGPSLSQHLSDVFGGDKQDKLSLKGVTLIDSSFKVGLLDTVKRIPKMYYAAFAGSEVIRYGFVPTIRLETLSLRLSGLYANIRSNSLPPNESEGRALCINGIVRATYSIARNVDDLASEAYRVCNGDFSLAVNFSIGGTFDDELRSITSSETLITIAAYFLSTFCIAMIYFAAMIISFVGLSLEKYGADIFVTGMFRTDELPFTIAAFALFVILEVVRYAVDALMLIR